MLIEMSLLQEEIIANEFENHFKIDIHLVMISRIPHFLGLSMGNSLQQCQKTQSQTRTHVDFLLPIGYERDCFTVVEKHNDKYGSTTS